MPSLVFDVSALDRASQAFNRIADRIDMLVARLAALNGASASVRLDVDTDPADRTLGRWTMDFRRRVREAMATIEIDVDMAAGATAVEREMGRIRRELATLLTKKIGVDIEVDDAVAQIEALKAQLAALDTRGANVQVRADVAAAIAALEAVLAEARRVDGEDVEIDVKVDQRGIRDIINAAALFQRSIAQMAKPVGLLAAVPGVISLIDSLEDLLGLLGLVPAAIFGAGAAVAALTTAFQGMGDAIKASTPEELAAALAELTPNAQESALAIRDLKEAWEGVTDVVQEATFDGVAQSLDKLAAFLPTVEAGLQGVGAEFGDMFNRWAEWASQQDTIVQTGQIFENLRDTIDNLGPGVTFFAEALTDMVQDGMELMPQFAQGFTDLGFDFKNFIQEVTSNGDFQAWILNAVDTLGQLVDIATDVATGFQGMMAAVNADGVTFLDTLEGWAQAFTDFTNSLEGAAALTQFFDTIKNVVDSIAPAVGEILVTFAELFVVAGPGLARLADAIAELVAALAPAIPIAGALISALTPIATAVATVVTALGPLPALALAAFLVFRTATTILTGFATVATFVGTQITLLGTRMAATAALVGASGLAGAITTATTGIVAGFGRVVSFLTGPFGIAILGAVAVIALLAGANDDAAAAAEEHRAAVTALRDTLEQYTGAVTEATVAAKAKELTDAGVLAQAREMGFNVREVTLAHLGEAEAIQNVQAQLQGQAETLVAANAKYIEYADVISRAGFSTADFAAAALAGGPALQDMVAQIVEANPNMLKLELGLIGMAGSIRESIEPLRAFAESIGISNDQLREAQEEAQLLAAAMNDFGGAIDAAQAAMTEFAGAMDLATGAIDPAAAGATQLAESFGDVTTAAGLAAAEAGRLAEATTGVGTGGEAAAASMERSRAAFLQAADAAGLSAEAAELLANQIGLIPELAQIIFETNATQTEQDLLGLIALINTFDEAPKTIVIDALTEEAQAKLQELGVEITKLEDGTILLNLEDSEFYAKLAEAEAAGLGLPDILAFLDLSTTEAQAELDAWVQQNSQGGALVTPISLDTSEADGQLGDMKARAEEPLQAVLFMSTAPFDATLVDAQMRANTSKLMPQLELDPNPFNLVLQAAIAAANAAIGIMTLDANPAPAQGKLDAMIAAVNAALGTMTIDADPGPAMGKLGDTKAAIDGAVGTMKIDADPGPALAKAAGAVARINGMTATITVTTREITVKETRTVRGAPEVSGGGIMRFAQGGIVPGYAPGIDSVPAWLSPGEAVLVPEAVRLLGERAILGLNRLASGGRKMSILAKSGADAYMSFGTPGGRTSAGAVGAGQPVNKTYILNVQTTTGELDLREQFRRMEILGS